MGDLVRDPNKIELSSWVRPSDLGKLYSQYIRNISIFDKHTCNKIYSQNQKKTSHSEMKETFQLIFVSPSQWLFGRVNILTFKLPFPTPFFVVVIDEVSDDSLPQKQNITSWWFQPIWKILVKLDHFPR